MWFTWFPRKGGFGFSLSILLLALASSLHAADGLTESAVHKTIIASLQPVIKMVGGNAWLQGIAVMVVTLTIASLVTWLLFKFLVRLTAHTRIEFDDQIVSLLRPPVYYTFLVSGFSYGLSLMPLSASVQLITTRCIQSVGVIVWIFFFIRLAHLILTRLASLTDKFAFIQHRTLTLFDNAAKVIIFSVGLYAIFVVWKIDMSAWLASAGVAGIAVGFAAKDTLSNLFSGVFILADAPYKVGDYIVLERAPRGKVTHIGLRSTRILTRDDVEITIPNSIIGNSTIINQSGGPSEKMRIRVLVGAAYGSDVDKIKKILIGIADDEPLVCEEPKPSVRLKVFGASSLDFELRCWVARPELSGRTTDALNSAIHNAFERAGIEIPYAKQDLYIKGIPKSFGMPMTEETPPTSS